MVALEWAGETLWLLPEKAIFWPAENTLIVADLHFGKPAAFRNLGIGVPENTTQADLDRLETIIRSTKSERLIILGDLLHARAGMQTVMMETVAQWRSKFASLEIILVPGNHDRKSGDVPESWNMRCVDYEWNCAPFLFTHQPMQREDAYVMAGHVHPALFLADKFGPSIRMPCFSFGKRLAILPAFGSFTGMKNIEPVAGDRVFAIGHEEIVEINPLK